MNMTTNKTFFITRRHASAGILFLLGSFPNIDSLFFPKIQKFLHRFFRPGFTDSVFCLFFLPLRFYLLLLFFFLLSVFPEPVLFLSHSPLSDLIFSSLLFPCAIFRTSYIKIFCLHTTSLHIVHYSIAFLKDSE